MAGLSVDFVGLDSLEKKLRRAPEVVSVNVKKVMDDTIQKIQDSAKRDAPVGKTKRLKNSITHRSFNFNTGGFVSAGNKNVIYAPYVEFGTGNKFHASLYPGVKMDSLEAYALTFKKPTPKRKVNLPHRPFLFSAFAEHYQSMVNGIKNVSTKI